MDVPSSVIVKTKEKKFPLGGTRSAAYGDTNPKGLPLGHSGYIESYVYSTFILVRRNSTF